MKRRTFLRTAGVLGAIGASGCSTPFDSVSVPDPISGDGTDETATPELTPTPEPPATRTGAALTGVYPGGPGDDLLTNLEAYSTWASQPPAVAMVFVDAFVPDAAKKGIVEGVFTDIWEAGSVPLVSWQPFLKRKQQTSETIEREIAQGKYDDGIETWADLLTKWARPRGDKTRGRRFYFRPAHEMNGDWFPWSAVDSSRINATATASKSADTSGPNPAAGTPKDYVEMWRRMHGIFSKTAMDETDIQWIWSPNVTEVGNIKTERYYPGDKYVDWVGLDGFNFGGTQWYSGWDSPEVLYDPMMNRMRKLTSKPIALTEFATSSFVPANDQDADKDDGQYRPEKKVAWIEDVFAYIKANDIKMACWFNLDKTGPDEADWAIFGGKRGTSKVTIDEKTYRAYPEYKRTVNSSEFLNALTDYPPLLTDEEFAGQF
ncbi:MAG TPA: glycosyl hydrolase [Halococcus sp.]|nr:glycosyl hydrolase [Halococcus sp.]